ncbi:hypothetical protein DTX80_17760 [Bacilli bacterium]|nr:hypothetical protein WH51_11445 [Bacilli bacterium VT-13-104]PZD83172.1 hypothetical protein DEJ64_16000 [Bacilli bacterium]PZD84284.1 hypothetical protein DEJ60_15020 [Bacilli bacterium]PZD86326.1 hypothetical protein DEJ66_15815 [Bacilli bacterium]RCO04296.1 hypothetical protein DTX80_17760 [Bacilli bacterium]
MSLDFSRERKGTGKKNPLLMTESNEKPKNDFRRNIKLTDPIFFKIRALMKLKDIKQYELIDAMADLYVSQLSKQEKEFYEYQLEEIRRAEEEDKK